MGGDGEFLAGDHWDSLIFLFLSFEIFGGGKKRLKNFFSLGQTLRFLFKGILGGGTFCFNMACEKNFVEEFFGLGKKINLLVQGQVLRLAKGSLGKRVSPPKKKKRKSRFLKQKKKGVFTILKKSFPAWEKGLFFFFLLPKKKGPFFVFFEYNIHNWPKNKDVNFSFLPPPTFILGV